jgi:hypothetical protein
MAGGDFSIPCRRIHDRRREEMEGVDECQRFRSEQSRGGVNPGGLFVRWGRPGAKNVMVMLAQHMEVTARHKE